MNELDFKDRTAVITGGASGIGLAVARRLVASGGRVSLWDRDAAALEKARGMLAQRTETRVVDVASHEGVAAAAKATAAEQLGRIDALVCSAGITGPNATTWEYPVDAWRQVMAINVDGVFFCNRAIVPLMAQRGYGRIVNIASVAGKEGNPNASAYSASKAAVIGLTKSLGKELAKTGIRVNCVTPAAVRTAIFEQITPAHIDFMLSKIPMGRFGKRRRLPRWLPGCARRNARSRPAQYSICRAAGQPTEAQGSRPDRHQGEAWRMRTRASLATLQQQRQHGCDHSGGRGGGERSPGPDRLDDQPAHRHADANAADYARRHPGECLGCIAGRRVLCDEQRQRGERGGDMRPATKASGARVQADVANAWAPKGTASSSNSRGNWRSVGSAKCMPP